MSIKIRSSAGTDAVFCVPGAGGNITSFLPLAEALGSGLNVYSIEPFAELEASSNARPRTVEAAAAVCVTSMREIGIERHRSLIGHSFGGWIAFETAMQLAREGEPLPQIFLIDTDAPTKTSFGFNRVESLLTLADCLEMDTGRELGIAQQTLDCLRSEDQIEWFVDHLKRIGLLAVTAHSQSIMKMIRSFELDINVPYRPSEPLARKVTIFQPQEVWRRVRRPHAQAPELTASESINEWRMYAADVEQIRVPGNHMTMLKAPNVQVIAEHITKPPQTAYGISSLSGEIHSADPKGSGRAAGSGRKEPD